MENYNGTEIPMGFGISLEQNNVMGHFLSLSKEEQRRIIDRTHAIQSKGEMDSYVRSIVEKNTK